MFLMAAMICGDEPVRTGDRCSRFSMAQWPRLKVRTSVGLACQVVRLVMPYTDSVRLRRELPCRLNTSRVIAHAW
jgi:hypothetical protein